MHAFAFGKLLGEKVAAQPMTAEAPLSDPAQAASTNKYLAMPGRNFLANMARTGQDAQRDVGRFAAASPFVGKMLGRALGGNTGSLLGGATGAAVGQQLRHQGGDVATAFGAQSAAGLIPYGLRDGRLTNQPSEHAKTMNADMGQTAQQLDAMVAPQSKTAPLLGNAKPLPQAQPSAPKVMPPRGAGASALKR